MMTMRIGLLALATTLSACTNHDNPSLADARGFFEQYEQTYCHQGFACMSSFPYDGQSFTGDFSTSESACISLSEMTGSGSDIGELLDDSVTMGRETYSEPDANTCIAALAALGCSEFWNAYPHAIIPCEHVVVGHVADGGACTIDSDCSDFAASCAHGSCTPS